MTSGLKALGNGSMEKGLKTIADYSEGVGFANGVRNGYTNGQKNGTLKGSAITALVFGAVLGGKYLYQKHKDKKAIKKIEEDNKENREKILDAFENAESVNSNETGQ